jgi:hypothetical protein
MPRRIFALVLACAVANASIAGTQSASAANPQGGDPAVAVAKNAPPLEPKGAAGIHQAQGIADLDVWFISGLIVASIVAVLLLADDEDDAAGTTE